MSNTAYKDDVIAWSREQAELLTTGRWELLDIEHLADEILDVGKSEQRELESRMALLLMHLLKWRFQPDRRGESWEKTIKEQRKALLFRLKKTPSLKPNLQDEEWQLTVWFDAKHSAAKEMGIAFDLFPDACPWTITDVLDEGWMPN